MEGRGLRNEVDVDAFGAVEAERVEAVVVSQM